MDDPHCAPRTVSPIQLEVPAGDGGVLVCTPGVSDECQQLLEEDCRATLSGVSAGSSEDFEIVVRNLSMSEALTIQNVSLSDSTDPALSIAGAPPVEIEPDTFEAITVRFSPGIPGEVIGRLHIESDAVNAGDEGTEIEIRAIAVE